MKNKTGTCKCGCGEPSHPGRPFAKYHRQLHNGRAARWNGTKYVLLSRLRMEEKIGRPLLPTEIVHHIDENHRNDSIENLFLCSSEAEHKSKFHNKSSAQFPCLICGKTSRGEKRRSHHFCSRQCWRKWKPPGAPITSGNGLVYTIICEQCGKSATRKGRAKGKPFCSLPCYHQWMIGKPSNRAKR